MGVDRLYVQPARTQHQELVPHWGSAQPHRIHRTTHTAPGVIQTRGREWRHPQGQLWGSDQLSPMPGWLSRCPAIFSSMQGSPAYRGICVHQAPRLVGGQVDCPSKNSPSQFTEHVHRRAPLESLSSGTGRIRVTDFPMLRVGIQRHKDRKWLLQAYTQPQGPARIGSWLCCHSCHSQAASGCNQGGALDFTCPLEVAPILQHVSRGVSRRQSGCWGFGAHYSHTVLPAWLRAAGLPFPVS